MDLLDFSADSLYFEEPIEAEVAHALERAAAGYASGEAESALLYASSRQPEQPQVLVALYRFFYYQHRLEEALQVAERVLTLFAARLNLPQRWQELQPAAVTAITPALRFYLLALKGAGYLELRLGRIAAAEERLGCLLALDPLDRLGAGALLRVVQPPINPDEEE